MGTETHHSRLTTTARILLAAFLGVATLGPVSVSAADPDPETILTSDGRTMTLDPALSASTVNGAYSPGWIPKGLKVAPAVEKDGTGIRASRGPIPMSIIGTDERVQVTNTATYPYSAIVRITYVGSSTTCSGFIVDRDTVITAGHCIYSGGWLEVDQVVPGQNGTSKPFGQCQERYTASVGGWVFSGNKDYDFGMIKLNCTVGFDTGWIGYKHTPGNRDGAFDTVGGYPLDKPTATQWRDSDSVHRTTDYRLFYANDTFAGQSGSPAWAVGSDGTTRFAIAIHTYAVSEDPNGQYNSGTRVNQYVYDTITYWKDAV